MVTMNSAVWHEQEKKGRSEASQKGNERSEKRNMGQKKKPLDDWESLGGQPSSKGSANAVKHGDRIARLSECKQRSRQMGHYLNELKHADHIGKSHSQVIDRLSADIRGCANYLVFHNYYTVDQIKLAKLRTCKKHMLCPFCARARAAKNVQKYMERFEIIMSEKPNLVPALLTLTVKNGADLEERFQHLQNAWKKFQNRRRDYFKRGRGFNELCKVDGAVFSYETTYNEEAQEWHPHLHVVVLLTDYIDREKLSQEWEKITGDSKIVDIRKLKPSDDGNMVDAFCEVFKYALKFSELSLEDNYEAYNTLKGSRLQGSFGSFWGVKVPEGAEDDLSGLEGLPYLEMFYQYMNKKGFDLKEVKQCEGEKRGRESERVEPARTRFESESVGQVVTRRGGACSTGSELKASRSGVPAPVPD